MRGHDPAAASRLAIPLLPALAACTPFESLWRKAPKPARSRSRRPAPPPELPLAEATHRFIVAPDQDVVGQLQVTIASHEDTLPDIARRFNVGYEEIVRANPGVDPWLPGEGTHDRAADRIRAARRTARRPRAESRGDAALSTIPKRDEGCAGRGDHASDRHRQGRLGDARGQRPRWSRTSRIRYGHRRCRCGRNTRRMATSCRPSVPAGPDNPLGRHMMRLGWPSYLIHGTNKPPGRRHAREPRLHPPVS